MTKVPLKGSERAAVPGARELAPAEATERMEVSVVVRRRGRGELQSRVAALAAGERSRGVMSRDEFAQAHGADPKDLSAVRAFAAAHGLAVLEEHAARRTVVLAGTVAQFCSAFAVQLHRTTHAGGTYRGRTGEIMLPPELARVVDPGLRSAQPPPTQP